MINGDSIVFRLGQEEGRYYISNGCRVFKPAGLVLILLFFIITATESDAQQNAGFGTTNPDPSSIIELYSNNQGFLVPRLTTAQRNAIAAPAKSLIIFNTTTNQLEYNAGTSAAPQWVGLISSGNLASGRIYVGDALNQATQVLVSGDATLNNTGVLSLSSNSVDGTNIDLTGNSNGDLMYYNGTDWVRLGIGSNGQVLKSNGTIPVWSVSTNGTVTSVGLSMPGTFTVGNSPVTDNATIAVDWASQGANTILSAPYAAAGLPAFRGLGDNDIPDTITVSKYLSLAGGTLSGNIDFAGAQTIDGVDLSAHVSAPDAHHPRSHAMTSSQDHTAGNWSMFYSDGLGAVNELPLGSSNYILQSSGNNAAPVWVDPATLLSANNWSLNGNNIAAGNYLGTPAGNLQTLIIKTDGIERIRVLPTGEVGIGNIADPDAALAIKGSSSASDAPALNVMNSSSDTIFYVRNDGKVSIGTNNPEDTVVFHVVGDVLIDGDLNVTGQIDPVSVTYQPQATSPSPAPGKVYFDALSSSLKIYTGSQWQDIASGSGSGSISSVGSMTGSNPFSGPSADGQWLGLGNNAGRIAFADNDTDIVDIIDARVGINKTAPAYTLDVKGTIRSGGDSTDGELRLYSEQGINDYEVVLRPDSTMTGNTVYTLPPDMGSSGQLLSTDGTGKLAWVNPPASGGSGLPSSAINGQLLRYNATDGAWEPTDDILSTGDNVIIGTSTPESHIDLNATTKIGVNGSSLYEIIRDTVSIDVPNLLSCPGTNNYSDVTVTVPGAVPGSTVIVSPSNNLSNGVIIGYAFVFDNNTVRIRFANVYTNNSNTPVMDYYITIIR